MIDLGPDGTFRAVCVTVAIIGVVVLVVSMVRFDQHRGGRVAALVLGSMLLLGSIGAVVWDLFAG